MGLNNVQISGRLTKDVDFKYTPSGKPLARFTVAVGRNYKNGQGQYETDFINCVAWGKTAELIANSLKKASRAIFTGSIETGSYEGQNGKVYTTEVNVDFVEFLEPKDKNNQGGQGNSQSQPNLQNQPQPQPNQPYGYPPQPSQGGYYPTQQPPQPQGQPGGYYPSQQQWGGQAGVPQGQQGFVPGADPTLPF